jgi:predicted RNase H-like HicB family nuclease/DNA-binding XRE family transcriptional regulator
MQYPAVITREGKYTLVEFPDCPGCQTFAGPGEDLAALAAEALEGWLEASLEGGDVPLPPSRAGVPALKGVEVLEVPVSAMLATVLAIRWARQEAELSQAALGKRLGISQQAVAKLEQPGANLTIETLERVARALGKSLQVKLVNV